MAVRLGELGRQGQDRMGHALIVGVGVGQTPAGQEFPVHVLPHAVGVDQRSVHIKKQQSHSSFSSQKRQG